MGGRPTVLRGWREEIGRRGVGANENWRDRLLLLCWMFLLLRSLLLLLSLLLSPSSPAILEGSEKESKLFKNKKKTG